MEQDSGYEPASKSSSNHIWTKIKGFWHQIRTLETVILFTVIIITGGLWGFIEIADEVMEGSTHEIDTRIILALRNPADLSDPIGAHWIEEIMRDFTALGGMGILTFLTLSIAGYQFFKGRPRAAWLLLITVASGTVISLLLKTGFDRPRPDLVSHGSYVATASFPSGHTMLSTVVYFTLGVLLARLQTNGRIRVYIITLVVLLTGLIGFSRVYLGVHWPTDVLAGWMAGAVWASCCWLIAWGLQRRGYFESVED